MVARTRDRECDRTNGVLGTLPGRPGRDEALLRQDDRRTTEALTGTLAAPRDTLDARQGTARPDCQGGKAELTVQVAMDRGRAILPGRLRRVEEEHDCGCQGHRIRREYGS